MDHWFGEPWPTPDRRMQSCSDDRRRIDVPVGEECAECHELVVAGDRGYRTTVIAVDVDAETGETLDARRERVVVHAECQLRGLLGGPAHLQGLCSCFRGEDAAEDSDLGMSQRDAARYVWDHVMMQVAQHPVANTSPEATAERALARATTARADTDHGIREAARWN